MNAGDHPSSAQRLLAAERLQAAAEIRRALQLLPAAGRKAADPARWFRRYPVATGAVAALSIFVLFGQLRAARHPQAGARRSWFQALSRDLLTSGRRALTSALTARLVWRGVTPGAGESADAFARQSTPVFDPSRI
jgi:hypothetical protein